MGKRIPQGDWEERSWDRRESGANPGSAEGEEMLPSQWDAGSQAEAHALYATECSGTWAGAQRRALPRAGGYGLGWLGWVAGMDGMDGWDG